MSNKTHKALAKRFKKTASGKVFHRANGKSHLLSHKTAKRKRDLRQWRELNDSEVQSLQRQYGNF